MPNFMTGRPRRIDSDVALLATMHRKIVSGADCWLWGGSLRSGYGVQAVRRWPKSAARVLYELMIAPIPAGLCIDHLCRVPACVNPWHIEPVTGRENTMRGANFSAVNACTS